MARLPVVGSDDGTWGGILNDYLAQQHGAGGEHLSITIPDAAAAGTDVFSSKISTDTQYRYIVNADGGIEWGAGGTSAPDTNLYRSAADTLKTDDMFGAGGNIYARHGLTGQIYIGQVTASPVRYGIEFGGSNWMTLNSALGGIEANTPLFNNGGLNSSNEILLYTDNNYWTSGTSPHPTLGLYDGWIEMGSGTAATDTNLYRSAANTLKTDDDFVVGGGKRLTLQPAAGSQDLRLGADNGGAGFPGISFGLDTQMYRAAADRIHTPDNLSSGSIFMSNYGYELYELNSTFGDNAKWAIYYDGKMQFGPGGASGADTNLYRSAADELKTDDTFVSATDIKVGSNSVYHAGNPPPASGTSFVSLAKYGVD